MTTPSNDSDVETMLGIGLSLTPLLLVLYFILAFPNVVNHDAALYIRTGQMLVEGKIPYVDIIDTNPPMIFYLNAIPAAVAKIFSANPIRTFHLAVLFVCFSSAWSIFARLHEAKVALRPRAVFVFAWCWINWWMWHEREFGQREHLFLLLYLPFLVRRCLTAELGHRAPWSACLTGCVAALGACIKPFFVVAALAPEVYRLAFRRTRKSLVSPEMLGFLATGVIYAAHFGLLPAASRQEFFGHLMPLMSKGYEAYGTTLHEMLLPLSLPLVLTIASVFASLWFNTGDHESAWSALITPLQLFTLVSFAFIWVLPKKTWFYHSIPVLSGAILLLCVVLLRAHALLPGKSSPTLGEKLATAAIGIFFLVCAWLSPMGTGSAELRLEASATDAIQNFTKPGDYVLMLDTSVHPTFPVLVQTKRWQAFPYTSSFVLPLVYADWKDSPRPGPFHEGELPPDESRFVDAVRRAVRDRRPPLILVRAGGCQGCPPGFTLYEYLRHTGITSDSLSGYDEIPHNGDVFHAFVRKTQ